MYFNIYTIWIIWATSAFRASTWWKMVFGLNSLYCPSSIQKIWSGMAITHSVHSALFVRECLPLCAREFVFLILSTLALIISRCYALALVMVLHTCWRSVTCLYRRKFKMQPATLFSLCIYQAKQLVKFIQTLEDHKEREVTSTCT